METLKTKVAAVVLAAGGSTRLGVPKQLLRQRDAETLVHAAVRAAREGGCKPVCLVTGAEHERIAQAVADLRSTIVRNENWRCGIGGSIRAGIAKMGDVDAIVLLACDQPAIDAHIIRALITKYRETNCAIIAAHYAGTLGIPALFDRSCFAELQNLPDEHGAKSVIMAHPERVAVIDFLGGEFDLDTPADLRAWRGEAGN